MTVLNTYLVSFLIGTLPALLWLWFWLHEDKKRPEPRGRILATFVAGMIVVPIAAYIQRWISKNFTEGTTVITLWAFTEEILKFIAVWWVALRSRDFDEPIDALIYLITVALGFAALENAFFVWNPLLEGNILSGLVTGNLRFIGAMLLHTISSSVIGISLAIAFYFRRTWRRIEYVFLGIIFATVLHTIFNFFIINVQGQNQAKELLIIFTVVWLAILVLIFIFEKVKLISDVKRGK